MNLDSELILLGKVLLAGLLGGIIGLEREYAAKPAGLRTHILVAASAVMLVGVGTRIIEMFPASESLRVDPLRIIEAIIVGISFLGAGTIFRQEEKGSVSGLTTAASILFTAAIGMSVALDNYILAGGGAVFALFINYGLGRFERRVLKT